MDKNATVLEEAVKKIDAETIGKVTKDTEICQQKNDITDESVDKEMPDGATASCKVEIIENEEKNDESNQSDVKVCDDDQNVQEEVSVEDDAEKPLVEFWLDRKIPWNQLTIWVKIKFHLKTLSNHGRIYDWIKWN